MILQVLVYRYLYFIFFTGIFFYILIPGIGAFIVRHNWRSFRKKIVSSTVCPLLDYRSIRGEVCNKHQRYRFFGSLQAMQGDREVWLSGNGISISIDLSDIPIYILPSAAHLSLPIGYAGYPDETPRKIKWNQIFSLSEGTRIFVSGCLEIRGGKVVFSDKPDNRLFVVIYDCSDKAFLSQAIWTGRQRNEYWNPATPGALTVGSFTLFILFYLLLQKPYMQFPAGIALFFSLVPVIPFFPPGLIFYYGYRYLWKKARMLRAERDLVKLPLGFFPEESFGEEVFSVPLPVQGAWYEMRKISKREMENYSGEGVIRKTSRSGQDYYLFREKDGEGRAFSGIQDPMAEEVIIPGNPLELSMESEKRAFKLEILSGTMIIADFLLNGLLFFLAIAYLLK